MRKLRMKIVLGVFVSATAVFFLTIVIIGLSTSVNTLNRADSITQLIEKYNGQMPDVSEYEQLSEKDRIRMYRYDEESPFRVRYFFVSFSEEDDVTSINTEHIAAINQSDARTMAVSVRKMHHTTGYLNDFRYRVSDDEKMVIFLDCSDELQSLRSLLLLISLVSLVFVLMITLVFYFLSNRIVRPFEENARMQKQFITDASHELKTPLAIISANAEVLAYKDGENEWINNITAQVTRVTELVNELLTLNRLEEIDTVADIEPVNLTAIVNRTADGLEELFRRKDAALRRTVQDNVVINGNAAQLERLVSVLMENASKYVSENGEAVVTLKKEARHTVFSVRNTCELDPDVNLRHLFKRFYRPDASRTSKTGGHGVGLSIAHRITVLHNGSIEAQPTDDGLMFTVKLSNKLKAGKHNKGRGR